MVYAEFMKLDFYKAFERWIGGQCLDDYYDPGFYNDETGEELRDPSFDEEGYYRAINNTVIAASRIYDQTNHKPFVLYDKSFDKLLDMAGLDSNVDICEIGVYGGIFLNGLVDYPNMNHKFGDSTWKGFEELVDGWFRKCADLHTWLSFYNSFYRFLGRSLLPEKLRQYNMMEYWRRLQEKGFVNEEYQIIHTNEIKNYHVGVIAYNLWIKSQCRWKDLENHFVNRDGKKFKNLRAEYKRRDVNNEIVREIEECFR